jgi:thiol-disulfide isomerase/thioredoxin
MNHCYLFLTGIFMASVLVITPSMSQSMADITLIELENQKKTSLRDFDKSTLIVLFFTSNYCPYAKLYEERVDALHLKFKPKGITFLAINANLKNGHNKDKKSELDKMWAVKTTKSIPYLLDSDQRLINSLEITKNPEVVVLSPINNGFEVVYKGAIDDNPQMPQQVNRRYLNDFLDAWVNKKPLPEFDVQVAGCLIKQL